MDAVKILVQFILLSDYLYFLDITVCADVHNVNKDVLNLNGEVCL